MGDDGFDGDRRDAALRHVAALLRERYVLPAAVDGIVERLEAGARAGRYDLAEPGLFAEVVGADLKEASGDKHLGVRFDPTGNAALRSARESDDAALEAVKRNHYGLVEQRLLEGNVRLLRLTDFDWVPGATDVAYDGAVRFLRDADAVVIDLRGNLGGEPLAVQYLVSHFLEPDVPVMTFVEAGSETKVRSLESLPAGRLVGVPLYVLTDAHTYSAGEAFAYHVREFGLGEVIGETTAGAAHVNERLPVGTEFVLSVSYGRPVHPATGTSWEGTGVAPTIETPAGEALDVAHALALERLAAAASSEELRAEYLWARVAVEARRSPPAPPDEATLASCAGSYGSADVVLKDGRLWLLRPGRHDFCLDPLTADGLYGARGNGRLRVRFEPGRMLLHPGPGAQALEYRRTGD
ncbi:S41 family peptidase [Actinoplanes sp. NPDC049681]|uniref:S41 family peptidase n=1 Tax=Actinoplanes sp. NPDC049681 TaxID=3363905 RepID=UPI0037BD3C63